MKGIIERFSGLCISRICISRSPWSLIGYERTGIIDQNKSRRHVPRSGYQWKWGMMENETVCRASICMNWSGTHHQSKYLSLEEALAASVRCTDKYTNRVTGHPCPLARLSSAPLQIYTQIRSHTSSRSFS